MKHLLFLLILCVPLLAGAQNTPSHNIPANTIGRINGGTVTDSATIIPVSDTARFNALMLRSYSGSGNSIRRNGAVLANDLGFAWYYNGWKIAASTKALSDTAAAIRSSTSTSTAMSGVSIQSGTGAKVLFSIPHGLPTVPSYINISANLQESGGWRYVDADSANIYVHYSVAPPAATNNLKWSWIARP